MPATPPRRPRPAPSFFGHRVVAATFVLALFGWGFGFYGPPIYLHAVLARTGWGVALGSAMVTLHFLAGVLVIAALPVIYRRFGRARPTFACTLLLALGVWGWAVATTPAQWAMAATASGMGWVGLGAAAVNAMISPWFVRRRPFALALAYNGASAGGIVLAPLWVLLLGLVGFAHAAATVGAAMVLCVGLLCWRVFSRTPQASDQAPDGDPLPAVPAVADAAPVPATPRANLRRDRRFVTLALGMALGLFAQIGLLAHLFSVLAPRLGEPQAGMAMALATAAAITGRTVAGWRLQAGGDRRRAAAGSYLVQVAGTVLLLLAGDTAWMAWLGMLLFGAGIGNATSLPPAIAQAEFEPATVQRVVPLIVAMSQAAYAFAPLAFGLLRGAQGGEAALFAAAAAIQAGAAASLWAGRTAHRAAGYPNRSGRCTK